MNFDGVSNIGPKPFAALIAQNNNANAATGRKIALKTNSFRILSTPKYTTYMFKSQNKMKHIAGPVCKPKESGKICGKVSIDGIHNLAI